MIVYSLVAIIGATVDLGLLWSIAETYRTHSGKSAAEYVCDLKEMNSLSGDTIHAGHYLTIYYYDSVPK